MVCSCAICLCAVPTRMSQRFVTSSKVNHESSEFRESDSPNSFLSLITTIRFRHSFQTQFNKLVIMHVRWPGAPWASSREICGRPLGRLHLIGIIVYYRNNPVSKLLNRVLSALCWGVWKKHLYVLTCNLLLYLAQQVWTQAIYTTLRAVGITKQNILFYSISGCKYDLLCYSAGNYMSSIIRGLWYQFFANELWTSKYHSYNLCHVCDNINGKSNCDKCAFIMHNCVLVTPCGHIFIIVYILMSIHVQIFMQIGVGSSYRSHPAACPLNVTQNWGNGVNRHLHAPMPTIQCGKLQKKQWINKKEKTIVLDVARYAAPSLPRRLSTFKIIFWAIQRRWDVASPVCTSQILSENYLKLC